MALFIGSALSRFAFPRLFGRERWTESKSVMAAGLVSGEGLAAAAIAVASSLIMKATWTKPW